MHLNPESLSFALLISDLGLEQIIDDLLKVEIVEKHARSGLDQACNPLQVSIKASTAGALSLVR
jgi:hypothetical protein